LKEIALKDEFLAAGRIVGTHGVRGEVRVEPWCDQPSFLAGIGVWHLDGQPRTVESARVHRRLVLAKLAGIDDIPAAQAQRGKTVFIRRDGVRLPEGRFFIQDILGLVVLDEASGATVGTLADVWPGRQDIYVVTDGMGAQHLIPNVPAFVKGIDWRRGAIMVSLIEGM